MLFHHLQLHTHQINFLHEITTFHVKIYITRVEYVKCTEEKYCSDQFGPFLKQKLNSEQNCYTVVSYKKGRIPLTAEKKEQKKNLSPF